MEVKPICLDPSLAYHAIYTNSLYLSYYGYDQANAYVLLK
jgi:hypothetical protein